MNIICQVSPQTCSRILSGEKIAIIRSRVPSQLEFGDTVFLYHSGHIHGYLTFEEAWTFPKFKKDHRAWLEYAARVGCISEPAACRAMAAGPPHIIILLHPVTLPRRSFTYPKSQSFIYTNLSPSTIS